jgi:hypothetical protein
LLFFVIALVPGCSQDKIITAVQVIVGHFLTTPALGFIAAFSLFPTIQIA